jgi:hypothetical protein
MMEKKKKQKRQNKGRRWHKIWCRKRNKRKKEMKEEDRG